MSGCLLWSPVREMDGYVVVVGGEVSKARTVDTFLVCATRNGKNQCSNARGNLRHDAVAVKESGKLREGGYGTGIMRKRKDSRRVQAGRRQVGQ